MSFFNELKRRNVFKVTIAYVVMAWLVMQVADVILNNVEAPGWVFHVILLLLGIGLLLAIFFAWAYELTPEGIKKEKDIDRTQSITHVTGRKLDYLIIAVLVVGLGYFAYDKFVLGAPQTATEQTVTAELESAAPDYSIAVLPFVNMSSDPNNEFFADGLSEELLNVLTHIEILRVAGRSSSFYYKDKDFKIADVGRELNVAYVLEGSVRKQRDQVRVTAQLIHAADDFHMWSDTYNFQLDDIFAVQDRIATEVAGALHEALLGEDQVADVIGTERAAPNIDATTYSVYLQALARMRTRTLTDTEAALELLRQVTEAAPEFAEGWAAMSDVPLLLYRNHGTISWDQAKAVAAPAVANALALAPDTSVVQAAWAHYNSELLENDGYQPAREVLIHAFERAIELDPRNPEALYWLGSFWVGANEREYERALVLLERALAIDPLRIVARTYRIEVLHALGRLDEARAYALESIRLFPQKSQAYVRLAWMEESRGRYDRAWLWLERSSPHDRNQFYQSERLDVAQALGYEAGMRDALAQLSFIPLYKHLYEAFFQLRDGEVAKAIETVEVAAVELGPKIFNHALGSLKAVTGDCAGALENYDHLYGDALYGDPESLLDRTDEWPSASSFVALCLGATGRADQAKAVAEAIVARTDWVDEAAWFSLEARYFHLRRIAALCVLGEEARALQRLEAYINGGLRELWGNSWLEIDQDLRFQALHNNPRFIELVKEVRADNARMLEAVLSGEVTLEDAP